ncbi:hypothetical protein GCM10010350_76200 [Streptomyces galilaeus]|nr:hypothetical protein GCM10010350_76200 [Streptomyces galilaeus]
MVGQARRLVQTWRSAARVWWQRVKTSMAGGVEDGGRAVTERGAADVGAEVLPGAPGAVGDQLREVRQAAAGRDGEDVQGAVAMQVGFLPLLAEGDSYGSRCRGFCFVADCPPGVFR